MWRQPVLYAPFETAERLRAACGGGRSCLALQLSVADATRALALPYHSLELHVCTADETPRCAAAARAALFAALASSAAVRALRVDAGVVPDTAAARALAAALGACATLRSVHVTLPLENDSLAAAAALRAAAHAQLDVDYAFESESEDEDEEDEEDDEREPDWADEEARAQRGGGRYGFCDRRCRACNRCNRAMVREAFGVDAADDDDDDYGGFF